MLPIMIAWVVGWGGVSKTQKDATGVGHKTMQGGAAISSMVPLFLFMGESMHTEGKPKVPEEDT